MTSSAMEAFMDELERLIKRFRHEWSLSYGEAVGGLTIVASDLCAERREPDDEDED